MKVIKFVNNIHLNIQRLRKLKSYSQQDFARELDTTRSSLSGYETGKVEIPIGTLMKIGELFKISIDVLLKEKLFELDDSSLLKHLSYFDLTGSKLRILATTVDQYNDENIELVPIEAKAGYRTGYADPEYLKVLPTFQLPFLSKQKKYRSFPITGDSMPPVSNGSFVTGEYLHNWTSIKDGVPYIVITKDDGIVFKILYNQIHENHCLLLCSTNPMYEPYSVPVSEIHEVWKFVNYISSDLPEPNLSKEQISHSLLSIQKEMKDIKDSIQN
jgi:transcriptional regulator with XRE-family HTH domain